MFYFCKLCSMRLDSRAIIIYNRCTAMKISKIPGSIDGIKKIGFFGLGKSNLSLLRSLPLDGCEIILRSEGEIDKASIPGGIKISRILTGEDAFFSIDEELLVLSPSVRRDRPELLSAAKNGVCFTSDPELFFESYDGGRLFAITGSDGKSTTATLIGAILSGRYKASVIGNIGKPMLESLSDNSEVYSAELSSFTLTYAHPRAHRAAVTNITPNHLNWHSSYEEYIEAKLSLLNSAENAVLSADDKILRKYNKGREVFAITSVSESFETLKKQFKCQVCITLEGGFIKRNGKVLLPICEIRRQEIYNIKNLICAIAMTDGYADSEHIRTVAREFPGLAHRAEIVMSHGDVDYINSSIDTTPSRTSRTLEALGRKVILILCGKGKGLSYSELARAVRRYASRVIITGEDAEKMRAALCEASKCEVLHDFDSAVRRAAEVARRGETVLLSPAATSFDEFGNFEERGERFKEIITDIFRQK